MTDAAYKPDTQATLWVTDAEMIRRMGVPEKIARQVIKRLDLNPRYGFPQKSKIWGNRRYWPAVKAYLDRSQTLKIPEFSGSNRNDE